MLVFWTSSVSSTRVPTIHALDTVVSDEIALNMCWGGDLPLLSQKQRFWLAGKLERR